MNNIVICIGSNQERHNVENALLWLSELFEESVYSSIYETPAVNCGGRNYHNSVLRGRTNTSHEELNELIKEYELSCGRDSNARQKGLVPIDIDIVIYNDEIIRPWDYRQNFFKIGFLESARSDI